MAKKKATRKGINGRVKGNTGENQFAKLWGVFWCNDKDSFKRTPGSGGWLGAGTDGDFVQVRGEPLCPFAFEIKRRETWDLDELIFKRKDKSGERTIESWWERTVNVARAKRQLPFMAFRKNRKPWLVMIESSLFRHLAAVFLETNRDFTKLRLIRGRFDIGTMVIMSWTDWEETFRPEDFLGMKGVEYGSRADSRGVGDSRAIEPGPAEEIPAEGSKR